MNVVTEAPVATPAGMPPANPRAPLSFGQERLWFLHQLGGSLSYHIPWIVRLTGNVQVNELELAWRAIIERHEVLRTVVREDDQGLYQHLLPHHTWQLQCHDMPAGCRDPEDLHATIRRLLEQPFDLSADYMLRTSLIRLPDGGCVMTVVLHHMAGDGWSLGILIREFTEWYAASVERRAHRLPALPMQYADFARWQRSVLCGTTLDRKLAYWRSNLAGIQPCELPTDFVRPPVQAHRGAGYECRAGNALTNALRKLALQGRCTLFMTVLAAFKTFLYRLCHEEDIVVGSPVAGRMLPETDDLAGFFVNMVVLRTNLGAQPSFLEVLQRVKETTLNAWEHQDAPFEKVVEAVVTERNISRSPLFQVCFSYRNLPPAPAAQAGYLMMQPETLPFATSQYDMTLFVTENATGISFSVCYDRDLFAAHTVERWMGYFLNLLHAIVEKPGEPVDRLPLLGAGDRNRLLYAFNNTSNPDFIGKTLTELWNLQVRCRQPSTKEFPEK